MYLRKIMVCNVTRFAYNRGTPGGALYLGSPKDRCVSDTCEKKIPDDYFGFSLWKPLGGCSGSVSRRPEVKIFKNGQLRLM